MNDELLKIIINIWINNSWRAGIPSPSPEAVPQLRVSTQIILR
jgi:hypothetical protein